jgi:hypothetical protein
VLIRVEFAQLAAAELDEVDETLPQALYTVAMTMAELRKPRE